MKNVIREFEKNIIWIRSGNYIQLVIIPYLSIPIHGHDFSERPTDTRFKLQDDTQATRYVRVIALCLAEYTPR